MTQVMLPLGLSKATSRASALGAVANDAPAAATIATAYRTSATRGEAEGASSANAPEDRAIRVRADLSTAVPPDPHSAPAVVRVAEELATTTAAHVSNREVAVP